MTRTRSDPKLSLLERRSRGEESFAHVMNSRSCELGTRETRTYRPLPTHDRSWYALRWMTMSVLETTQPSTQASPVFTENEHGNGDGYRNYWEVTLSLSLTYAFAGD